MKHDPRFNSVLSSVFIKGLGWVVVDDLEEFESTKPNRSKTEIRERKEKRRKARKSKSKSHR